MGVLTKKLLESNLKFPSGFFSGWSSVTGKNEESFRAMVEFCLPIKNLLEIGTHMGLSAALLAEYCEKVYTIDIIATQEAFKDILWEYLGVVDKIEHKVFHSSRDKKKFVDSLEYDFVFIDGSHMWESVKYDFSLVYNCKNILFHDFGGSWKDVKRFVNFVAEKGWGEIKYELLVSAPFALLRKL